MELRPILALGLCKEVSEDHFSFKKIVNAGDLEPGEKNIEKNVAVPYNQIEGDFFSFQKAQFPTAQLSYC